MTRRKNGHNTLFDRFISQFPATPKADGTPAVLGLLTRQSHDSTPLFGCDGIWASVARYISEPLCDMFHGPFDPSFSPVGHFRLVIDAQLFGNSLVGGPDRRAIA